MSEEVAAEILQTHILDLAAQGRRLDGRGPDDYRPVAVEPGLVTRTEVEFLT